MVSPQRFANYRDGIERVTALIARRAELVAALPPARERFESAIAEVPDRAVARNLFRAQNQIAAALLAHDPAAAEQAAQRMRALSIDDSDAAIGDRCLRRCDQRDLAKPKTRSPISTGKCSAPKAGRSGG